MKSYFYILLFFIGTTFSVQAQEIISLWSDVDIPNYQENDEIEFIPKRDIKFIQKVQKPTLEIFLPSKQNANGKAVLILPGGGYAGVAYDWEGTDYAKWFNSQGIAAFVLKYRMPQSKSVITSYKAPIQDAQRATRYIRFYADKFNIDKNKVGVIGSSAGGHLASTLGTHTSSYYTSKDNIDKESYKPDFMMLIYPVISMDQEATHMGSRNKLLGKIPHEILVNQFSNQLQVTVNTPKSFIIHSGDDKVVPVENSLLFYRALLNKKISATLHVFPKGGHGYSLGKSNKATPDWTQLAEIWLNSF